MSTFNTDDPTYQELVARVLQSDARVVPFVGAGLSLFGGPDERLPLWRELVERLLAEGTHLGLIDDLAEERITADLDAGQPIAALDRVVDLLGEPTFRRVVEKELDVTDRPVPPAVTELVAIGWSLIVTTNLDHFVARAYLDRHGAPINSVPGTETHRLVSILAGTENSPETSLARIHGDLDLYTSWRLTGNHYREMLQDDGYMEALKHLFLRQVFFVGFGLQDEDFDLLLETISQIYKAGAGEFFALLPEARRADPHVHRLVRLNGLRPIFYDVEPRDPSDPFGGHRAVFECLQHLAHTWAKATLALPFTLKYFPELDPNFVGRDGDIEQMKSVLLSRDGSALQLVGLGGIGKTSLAQQFLELNRLELAEAGFERIFGCSFYRAEVGEFVQDLELACLGPSSLPLPEKVSRICDYVIAHRLFLVLDGLENVLDDDLNLSNPYLLEIIRSVRSGGGAVLSTSRVSVPDVDRTVGNVVDLGPLDDDQIEDFLRRWELDGLPDSVRARLRDSTGGHPLALRVLIGVLRGLPTTEAIAAINQGAVLSVKDELDPLRENQLARVLVSYLPLLSDVELEFMCAWSVFDRPASFPLVEAVLTRDYVTDAVNELLVGAELRPIVNSLLDKRLLAVSQSGDLTSHPTVREFFRKVTTDAERNTDPLHRFLAVHYLAGSDDTPHGFDGMVPLLSACRHAAAYQDWSLFDDLVQRRIMRDFRNYLCNNLGAWDETLGVAQLAAGGEDSGGLDHVFYQATVARCLKHLGQTDESREQYLRALVTAASVEHPETAKHTNNLLTMLIWRGDLADAERLIQMNLRALSWIGEEWRYRWQVDHGLSSIAYLKLVQGDWERADELFERSSAAWDGFDGERISVFDNYPLHRSELFLRRNDHQGAIDFLTELQRVAVENKWPEAIARGHLHIADVYRSLGKSSGDAAALGQARSHLDSAAAVTAGMVVADVVLGHKLAHVRLEIDSRSILGSESLSDVELESHLDASEKLVAGSQLRLAVPELVAARGLIALRRGDRRAAEQAFEDANERCRAAGNRLFPSSDRFLVGQLGQDLGVRWNEALRDGVDPFVFVGQSLNGADLVATLDELRAD